MSFGGAFAAFVNGKGAGGDVGRWRGRASRVVGLGPGLLLIGPALDRDPFSFSYE